MNSSDRGRGAGDIFLDVLLSRNSLPPVGQRIRSVDIPGRRTTSCCFGGKDYSELYVTCACQGYTEEEMKRIDPLAGSTFRVTGLGVRGTPAFDFKL